MNVQCPFCGEGDFDLPGLKTHLVRGGCADFNAIEEYVTLIPSWAARHSVDDVDRETGRALDDYDAGGKG